MTSSWWVRLHDWAWMKLDALLDWYAANKEREAEWKRRIAKLSLKR